MMIICLEVIFLSLCISYYYFRWLILLFNFINIFILKNITEKIFFLLISMIFIFKIPSVQVSNLTFKKFHFVGKIKNNKLKINRLDNNLVDKNGIVTNLKTENIESIEGEIKFLKEISNNLFLVRVENFKLKENSLRNYIKDIINDLSDSKLLFNFFHSVILGENYLNRKIIKDFRESGLIHLLALSGLHLNILANIFNFFLIYTNLRKKNKDIVVFSLLTLYFFTVQFSPSILRAYLMYLFRLTANFFKEEISNLKSLYLAMIVSLIFDHTFITNLSFQMSFLATLSIFLGKFENKLTKDLIILLFLTPIQLIYFKNLNLSSFIYNFIFMLFFDFIIKLSFLIVIFKIIKLPNFLIEILLFVCYNLLKVTLYFLNFLLKYINFNMTIKNSYLLITLIVIFITIDIYFIWRYYKKNARKNIKNY